MGGFPIHRHADAGAAARVIEEDYFFERTRIELPVLAELERDHRKRIRFARGIHAEGVGLPFMDAHGRVDGRGKEKEDRRKDQ
jgi:hypothetical protein